MFDEEKKFFLSEIAHQKKCRTGGLSRVSLNDLMKYVLKL